MILFMIGTYVFIRTNYLVCVTLMTPYILLLFHLLYPADFRNILSDRVIDTAIGSAISFLANIFILPTRERGQITDYMILILGANAAYFRDVSCAFTGRPVPVAQYKLSRKNAFVALANLSDAFSRILSEPRGKREHADRMHQFVVSNHMLTSHIATLSYYALPESAAYADPLLYEPVIEEIGARLQKTIGYLADPAAGALPAGAPGAGALPAAGNSGTAHAAGNAAASSDDADALKLQGAAKQDLRLLNDKMNQLVDRRKAELQKGVIDSETRRQLSGFKPIVDQFNFIAKVTVNIERLSKELGGEAG